MVKLVPNKSRLDKRHGTHVVMLDLKDKGERFIDVTVPLGKAKNVTKTDS